MKVWIATDHADMRKGFDGLALAVQEQLKRDPRGGNLFVFRGRPGDLRDAFARLLDDGRLCLSNNAAERAMRGVAVWGENWTFFGSDRGGEPSTR